MIVAVGEGRRIYDGFKKSTRGTSEDVAVPIAPSTIHGAGNRGEDDASGHMSQLFKYAARWIAGQRSTGKNSC
jgi:hypothetical protein